MRYCSYGQECVDRLGNLVHDTHHITLQYDLSTQYRKYQPGVCAGGIDREARMRVAHRLEGVFEFRGTVLRVRDGHQVLQDPDLRRCPSLRGLLGLHVQVVHDILNLHTAQAYRLCLDVPADTLHIRQGVGASSPFKIAPFPVLFCARKLVNGRCGQISV